MHVTKVIDIGDQKFQIDFRGNSIKFWLIENGNHRQVGNASFVRAKDIARFDGGITLHSPRTVLRLAQEAKAIFHEKNPGVRIIGGHGVWLRRGKPPVARSHDEMQRLQAKPRRQPPKRKPH